MATPQFQLNVKDTIQKVEDVADSILKLGSPKQYSENLKLYITKLLKDVDDKGFFADKNWDGIPKINKNGKIEKKLPVLEIKVSLSNLGIIWGNIGALPKDTSKKTTAGKKEVCEVTYQDYTFKFSESSKTSSSASGTSTAEQERCTAFIFKLALNENIEYKTWQDIQSDGKYSDPARPPVKLKGKFDEMKKIYPGLEGNEHWLRTFWAQHKIVLDKYSNQNYREFLVERDGGFMKFISDLVKKEFGINKKDTWDPADVWIIKGPAREKQIIQEIEDEIRLNDRKYDIPIQKLNTLMRKYFQTEELIGISLKSVSRVGTGATIPQAAYKEYNLSMTESDVATFSKNKKTILDGTFRKGNFDLSLKNLKGNKGLTFGTQDTTIFIDGKTFGDVKFQIKALDSTKLNQNLKFEGTPVSATAARIGKAEASGVIDLLTSSLKSSSLTSSFPKNDHTDFPKTNIEFINQQKTYTTMFLEVLKFSNMEFGGVKTESEFVKNMTIVFTSDREVATPKLMQLAFLHDLYKLSQKPGSNSRTALDEFLTDLVFMASKIGPKFGPHGKIY